MPEVIILQMQDNGLVKTQASQSSHPLRSIVDMDYVEAPELVSQCI